jgi:hypothetical protein
MVTESEAIEAAEWPRVQARWPQAHVDAWFGELTMRPDHAYRHIRHRLVWIVKISNIERRRQGRGGSAVFTESYAVIDAKTGKSLMNFSYR